MELICPINYKDILSILLTFFFILASVFKIFLLSQTTLNLHAMPGKKVAADYVLTTSYKKIYTNLVNLYLLRAITDPFNVIFGDINRR